MTTVRVEAREEVAPGIVLFTLRPERPLRELPPGSHIDIMIPLARGVEKRSYSVVDLGADDDLVRIAIRLDPAGRGGSAWLHGTRPGTELTIDGPIDDFAPSPDRGPSVLLAAGIGITPILGLARAIKASGTDYRVIYTGRSRERMAFVDHLENTHRGRVDVVETAGGNRVRAEEIVAGVPKDGVLYVCGPMGLLTAVRATWQQGRKPPGSLRFESFGTSGAFPTRAFRVDLPKRGVSVEVPVGTSILDALEAAGIELMYDCLRGECGLCRVRIVSVEGQVDHRDVFLSPRQRLQGTELHTCVSRVSGPAIALDC